MKKLLLLLIVLVTSSAYCQNYEAYVGSVISEDKDMKPGYILGANFIIKTNQNRDYLNNILLGFEHSAFMSNVNQIGPSTQLKDNIILSGNCNCTSDNLESIQTASYTTKKEVRAVSLNFGVETLKRLYLITGVTNYQHIQLVNNEKLSEYRTMHIDAGVKYFIKINKSFIVPTFKFNPETISFGIGYSR